MSNDSSDKKVFQELLKNFAEQLYLDGKLKKNELDDRPKILKLFREALDHPQRLYFIIDHRENLLENAKKLLNSDDIEMAIVTFAMFFEHTINYIISYILDNKQFDKKIKKEVLRGANLKAKLTWILALLGLPKFNLKHEKFILKLADERNAFVHYKFIAVHINSDDRKDLKELIDNINKSVKYIKIYESKIIFDGKKKIVDNMLSNL